MSGLAADGLKNDSVILKVKILSYIFTLLGNAIYCKHVIHWKGGTTIHPPMSLLKSSFQKYLL